MLTNKENQQIQEMPLDYYPDILELNRNAEPVRFMNYREYVRQASKSNILWSMGEYEVTLYGGTNARTGKRSKLVIDTIVAMDNDKSPFSYISDVPTLTNEALFKRDQFLCAYCGNKYRAKELTRDHVHPTSRGGVDEWDNVVAACKPCNSYKGSELLSEGRLQLLYVPYTPNYYESLILRQKNILADQMKFLIKGVHKNSRLRLLH